MPSLRVADEIGLQNGNGSTSPEAMDVENRGIVEADDTVNDLLMSINQESAFDSFDWMKLNVIPYMTPTTQDDTMLIGNIPLLLGDSIPASWSQPSWPVNVQNLDPDPHLQVARSATIGNILHIIYLFLDRLHASMPFFKRSYLIDNIHAQRPLHDQSFNALIHAISALTVFQMVQKSSGHPNITDEIDKAEMFLAEAVRLHSHADFGENPVLEHVLTSVFLFGCQFSKGNHHAARFRLREAVTLAETMGLDDPQTYESVSRDEKDRRLRTFLCLTVIHRVYAIQRDSPVNDYLLTSNRLHMVRSTLKQLTMNSGQQDEKSVAGLGYMVDLIDCVDSAFVKCWRNQCWEDPQPNHISARTISALLQRHTAPMPMRESPNDAQRADVLITRHWICHILLDLASRHGFLQKENQLAQMRPDYALTIARDAIETCESLEMASLECHGIGLVEKLYDIITSAIKATQSAEIIPERPHLHSAAFNQDEDAIRTWPLGTIVDPAPTDEDGSLWHDEMTHSISTPCLTDIANRFLVIFASFRGGKHPYLKPYMRMLCDLDLD
ncbi:hypothetical protein yc1106_05222 [Curvularia clavata]|uniref:Transcription factor domain-containing protein n=1 Tax=Curvularia clavata TaxID=95742 RepID=A0A9Q9DRV6_CURCL|nr:hypothetical protein yc1106_05222 [Curvularia clavata]